MTHYLRLHNEPFQKIKEGKKSVEIRLFDAKRRILNIGDELVITNRTNLESLHIIIQDLVHAKNFRDLIAKVTPEAQGNRTLEEALDELAQYYTADQEQQYGVIGIKLR
jgi:ASC-1-like (ASCH) protein